MTCTTWPALGFVAPAGFFAASVVLVAMSPRNALSAISLQPSADGRKPTAPLAFQRFRPTHDLRQLLRDHGLARAVVGAPQQVQHIARAEIGRASCRERV